MTGRGAWCVVRSCAVLACAPVSAVAQQPGVVYRMVLYRAAPGRLLDLIDLLNARMPALDAAGEERPLILRHSQGDQWDLMVLQPVGSLAAWFSHEHDADIARRLDTLVAWREEEFVAGPSVGEVRARDRGAGFYHIEMMIALAGKRTELVHEREMENAFSRGTAKPDDLIFTRIAGAAWDVFTIGFYRDIKQFAEDTPLSAAAQDSVARAAGFASRSRIGSYLRELIASHHDTLAGRAHQ